MVNRRSDDCLGFVDFPISSKIYKSTNEGGLCVQLWAVANARPDAWSFLVNATSYTHAQKQGPFIGTDTKSNEPISDTCTTYALSEKFFPFDDYTSIPLIACTTVGITGWSGCRSSGDIWRCRYANLTADGKALYNLYKKLYGMNCKIHIMTFLDT